MEKCRKCGRVVPSVLRHNCTSDSFDRTLDAVIDYGIGLGVASLLDRSSDDSNTLSFVFDNNDSSSSTFDFGGGDFGGGGSGGDW